LLKETIDGLRFVTDMNPPITSQTCFPLHHAAHLFLWIDFNMDNFNFSSFTWFCYNFRILEYKCPKKLLYKQDEHSQETLLSA